VRKPRAGSFTRQLNLPLWVKATDSKSHLLRNSADGSTSVPRPSHHSDHVRSLQVHTGQPTILPSAGSSIDAKPEVISVIGSPPLRTIGWPAREYLTALWLACPETSSCRGRPELFYPVFVFGRQIQQPFPGKGVSVFSETTTAFGLFFQDI
jgi:hypothetical protein